MAPLPASHNKPQHCLYTQNRCSQRGTAGVGSSRGNQQGGCDTNTRINQVEWYRSSTLAVEIKVACRRGDPYQATSLLAKAQRDRMQRRPSYSPSSSSDLEEPSRGSPTSLSDPVPTFLTTSRTISCTSSGMSSRVSAGLEWVLSLSGSRSWSLMTPCNEREGEQTG